MIIEPKEYDLNGHRLVLRSAEKKDAEILLPYLARVCGETRFLLREADECNDMTIEGEEAFILSHAEKDRACLILAELDGIYAGNASFDVAGVSRRHRHRADLGIALYQEFTGMGIGKKLFALLLDTVKSCGFESAELNLVSENAVAMHLYESFGFIEVGRIPRAVKYDDGSYADDVYMMKDLRNI